MTDISQDQIEAVANKVYDDWIKRPTDGSFIDAVKRAVEAGVRLSAPRRSVGLTRQQRELLTYIEAYVEQNDIPPSFDEMKEAMGLRSKSGIHRMIVALEERGCIRRLPNRARAIELVRV